MPAVDSAMVARAAARRRTRRGVLSGGALTLAGSGVRGACGGSAGDAAPPAAVLDRQATVVWFNLEGTGVNLEGNDKSLATFKAKFPAVTVENAAQPAAGEAYYTKLFALVAAGTAPDLVEHRRETWPTWWRASWCSPSSGM